VALNLGNEHAHCITPPHTQPHNRTTTHKMNARRSGGKVCVCDNIEGFLIPCACLLFSPPTPPPPEITFLCACACPCLCVRVRICVRVRAHVLAPWSTISPHSRGMACVCDNIEGFLIPCVCQRRRQPRNHNTQHATDALDIRHKPDPVCQPTTPPHYHTTTEPHLGPPCIDASDCLTTNQAPSADPPRSLVCASRALLPHPHTVPKTCPLFALAGALTHRPTDP
jgi:hypothetical protein